MSPDARQSQRRERLLAAGIRAFGAHGFHSVTVRQICAEAELTERYFYESFANLQDLFAAIYKQLTQQLKQVTLAAAATSAEEPLALAESMLRAFLAYIREDPRRARIMFIDTFNIGHDVIRLADTATDDYSEVLRRYLERFYPAASTHGSNPDFMAQALVGANIHVAIHWIKERFRTPFEEVVSTSLTLYRSLIALYEAEGRTARANAGAPASPRPARLARPARKHTPQAKRS